MTPKQDQNLSATCASKETRTLEQCGLHQDSQNWKHHYQFHFEQIRGKDYAEANIETDSGWTSLGFVVMLAYHSLTVEKYSTFNRDVMTPSKTKTYPQPVLQRKCVHSNSVVFIKTHKTGSTTISSILNKYGERHNMSFIANKRDPTRGHFRFFLVENKTILPPPGGKGLFRSQYRNGQWVDILGSSSSVNDNMTHVKELIEELDKKVQFEEFEDLLYVKMNQRPSDLSAVMSEDQREKIREWNKADMLLYDHYNRTLWRKIAEIGPNFYKDFDAFQKMFDNYGR
eukprot:XP_011664490.1 PREDICTED: uncharacterized protein LOC105438411 [Strongylocentrotus purpuratus]